MLEEAGHSYDLSQKLIKEKGTGDQETLKHMYSRQANLLYEKARRSFNGRKYEESLQQVGQALELHITKDKLYLKANVFVQLKMPEKAVQIYKDIIRRDPGDYAANEFLNQFAGRR